MSASATRPKIKAVIKKKDVNLHHQRLRVIVDPKDETKDYPMTVAELTRLFDEANAKDDRMRVGLYARAGDTDYFYHESGGRSTDYPTGWYYLWNNDTAQTFKWIRLKDYSSAFTPDTLIYRLNRASWQGAPKQPCFQVSKPYVHIKGKIKGQCNYGRDPFSTTCRRTRMERIVTRFY
jgi:hypothetical protein